MKSSFIYEGEWFANKNVIDSFCNGMAVTNDINFDIFGELLMLGLGINGDLMEIRKTKGENDYYNLFYGLEDGREFAITFPLEKIIKALKDVVLEGEMETEVRYKER